MSDELEKSLESRQWPPVGSRRAMWKVLRATEPHVVKGRVFNRELRLTMGVSEPIAPGESAITALTLGSNGHVYGATRVDLSQRNDGNAHLFFYSTEPLGDAVVDLPFPEGVRACGNALVPIDGLIYGGVSAYDAAAHDGGFLFVHDAGQDMIRPFHSMGGPTDVLAVPVPGEGVATLAAGDDGTALVGISTDSAQVFGFDIESERVWLIDRPAELAAPCPTLASGVDGKVYGVDAAGRLFRIDVLAREIEVLPLSLPDAGAANCTCVDPATGTIYFGTLPGGHLVALDVQTMSMKDFGAMPPAAPIRAMTVGHDGHVYGVAGPRGELAKLFEVDPTGGNVEMLGALMATSERYWHGYEFDAACTGRRGEIYLGESDRISHLFLYFPPQPTRA